MVRSIRGRLQLWYALILLAAIAGFGGLLYYSERAARLGEIDRHLVAATNYLDAGLRGFPRYELVSRDRETSGHAKKGAPFISPKHLEMLHHKLELPPALPAAPGEKAAVQAYFIVWRHDGTVLKASPLPEGVPTTRVSWSFPDQAGDTAVVQHGLHRQATHAGLFGTSILVGKCIREDLSALVRFQWQLFGSGGLVLTLGLLGGWFISSRIVRPLAVISRQATSISAANLSQRLNTQQIDAELLNLAGVLNAMFARLEEAFERQKRFTADASHELRTPLAILQANVELALARPRSADEYREALGACLEASARMRALVDGLLTLARADAGKLDLHFQQLDLRSVVHDVLDQYHDEATQRQVELTTALPDVPVTVAGDAVYLSQVLANLLSNALRHTPVCGRVEVVLRRIQTEVQLCVADTGCGIAAADQPRVFERFFRADQARARSSGGVGLGLAICQCLVEAHRGRITLESEIDRGSAFTVCLPATDAADPAQGTMPREACKAGYA